MVRCARMAAPMSWLALVLLLLVLSVPAAAQDTAPAGPQPVDQELALTALQEALRYVEAEVPFVLGGKVSVDRFLELRGADPQAAASAGVDASGLVIQAFRSAVPSLRLYSGPPEEGRTAEHVTSAVLHRYNVVPVSLDQARPGDLLFFRSPQSGQINGVAIVHLVKLPVVRVVVASATQGKVVETGIDTRGTYWAQRVAGLGRLAVPVSARPVQAAPSAGQSEP